MGRLTLNVLLSFAQFEREVTGERIRDKIAASKKKGMWMGGNIPLGYDASERTLVINPAEAETVRCIFALYRELGCVRRVKEEADRRGLRTKCSTTGNGTTRGGRPFSRELRTRVFDLGRDREFADSPLEGGGFELPVPREIGSVSTLGEE
jgi:DNA invertase Pin-like site-specific DNA recombinase